MVNIYHGDQKKIVIRGENTGISDITEKIIFGKNMFVPSRLVPSLKETAEKLLRPMDVNLKLMNH